VSRRYRLWAALVLGAAGAAMAADGLFQPGAFPVKRVSFEGEFRQVTPEALRDAVAGEVHGNFFSLDLERVERAAKALPWVDRVSVRREWPQSLHIQYTEHRIIARWGEDAWLSSSGALVSMPDAAAQGALPRLEGPPGSESLVMERLDELRELTRAAGLEVAGLRLTPRRAWQVTLSDSAAGAEFAVMLGRAQLRSRIVRFVRVYRSQLANLAGRVERVDLRYPNGFAVAWKADGQAPG
jgi:cell division protein FtsQ